MGELICGFYLLKFLILINYTFLSLNESKILNKTVFIITLYLNILHIDEAVMKSAIFL